ncbi:MAG: phosphohydrolase [Cyanobacteria bacterium CRU_2_1]|nr:phosphohydrolase [Cyanobacteria bacterium RU_5_0]NJR63327.1 phosphohydrolase [Cyanobacteria bacterium CRU_2_1]
MRLTIPEIRQLYKLVGHDRYDGESVSQLDHALQCATLAEAAHQPDEMIVACLLHDMGHLLSKIGGSEHHEYRSMSYLRSIFSPAVTEPIRLHVQAKRYLCAIDRAYWDGLSPASKQSLAAQGGIFSETAAATFIAQPYASEAIQLRRWDDQAKIIGLVTPDLEHFTHSLQNCA